MKRIFNSLMPGIVLALRRSRTRVSGAGYFMACGSHPTFLRLDNVLGTHCFKWPYRNRIMFWAWMLLLSHALGTRTLLCFGHGCFGYRMLLEHERNSALGMDAVVTVCSWNTNVIMLRAWMLWLSSVLGAPALLWFGHRRSGHRTLLVHEHYYVLGMDALVIVRSWNVISFMLLKVEPYSLEARAFLCAES